MSDDHHHQQQQQQQFNSIEEIEDNKTKWNLTSDLKLLRLLKNTSTECMDRMQKNLNGFDELNFKADNAANKVNNLITDILILTNTKFIENRVYDEDLKDITNITKNESTVAKTVVNDHPPLDDEQKLIKKLENSVDKAMQKLSSAYDISQDDLIENSKYNLLHTLYTKKNRFSQKRLPYIIGSDEFLKDTFVGLKDEIDFPVFEPKQQQQQQQQQTIDQCPEPNVSNHVDEPHQNNINEINDIDQPEYSGYKLRENSPVIVNNNNNIDNLFDNHGKPQMPVYSDSSEDEDIFTRPTVTRTNNIMNGENALMNDDEQESTLFKSTISDEKDDLFQAEHDDRNDFDSVASNQNHKTSNRFLVDDDDEDDDFDNIFNTKSSQKVNDLKTKTTVFFSSDDDNDDDDDDFFAQISKSSTTKNNNNNNKVSSTPLPQAHPVDILKNDPIDDEPILENASKPPKSSASTIVTKINDQNKSKKEELSNVINELNSVLQKKMSPEVEQKNSSNVNDDDDDDDDESNPVKSTDQQNKTEVVDDFNSMLKHKTRLNSKRVRKPPTKFKQKLTVQAEPPKPEPEPDHSESDDLFGVVETLPPKEDPVVDRKLDHKIPAEPEDQTSDLDDIFVSSVSVAKAPPTPESVPKSPPGIPPKQNDLRTKSIFDSSDDSDEDLFNKKSSNFPTVSSQQLDRKTVSLFPDDSDDDDDESETKLSINRKPDNVVPMVSKRQTVSSSLGNEISKTTKNKKQVKSIFDDDDDDDDSDDDLFKF